MPTYSYECKKCGHSFDVFHGMSATPEINCASCGSKKVEKMIGTGGGIIFKGGGFYETDYKAKKGEPQKEPKESKETKPEKKEGCAAAGGCACAATPEPKPVDKPAKASNN